MCNYFSCIVTKQLVCLWSEKTMKHEDIIKQYQVNEKREKLDKQDFVRIEINPIDLKKITRTKNDWKYKIDEDGTLSQWFLDNREKAEKLCWIEWQKSIKVNMVLGNESIEITDKFIFASGNANVVGYDSSRMEGYDSSSMEGHDSSRMEGHASSQIV